MDDDASSESELDQDLEASESRESQLWGLTLAFLLLFGAGTVAAGFLVAGTALTDEGLRRLTYRLLGGLAVLIALFCLYVFQTRIAVSRVKVFMNAMTGMATGNLAVRECFASIVRGFAETYRTPVARLLLVRESDRALQIASTHNGLRAPMSLEEGYSHSLDRLPLLDETVRSREPRLLTPEDLGRSPQTDAERQLLTGGLQGLNEVLLLPIPRTGQTAGVLVLARASALWKKRLHGRELAVGKTLARRAGVVIEEVIRRRDAIRDPLTDLYNRRHFEKRIREELSRASREKQTTAVLVCDLDRFKQVNDIHGHECGDEVLKFAATTVRSATRGTDLHFRWGGDELVVVLSNTSEEGVLRAGGRIRKMFLTFARQRGFDVDMSIGAALYPRHGQSPDDLVRVADLAMYVAKKCRDKVRVGFETYVLDDRCVKLVYQPIRHLDSKEIFGHEVFVRDPGGKLTPMELFKRYRAVGQLESLKQLIMELQLAQARELRPGRLFLNTDLEFLRNIAPVAKPPEMDVVLELSDLDARYVENGAYHTALARWRNAGYLLALSGFGTGHIPETVLERTSPDCVKLSRASLQRATGSRRHLQFLGHLVMAVRSLSPAVMVAEGIEDRHGLEAARRLGVELGQGYLLGRPGEGLPGDSTDDAARANGPR